MLYPLPQQDLAFGPFVQDGSAAFVDVPEVVVDVEDPFETSEADDVDVVVVLTLLEARRTCLIVVGFPLGPQT